MTFALYWLALKPSPDALNQAIDELLQTAALAASKWPLLTVAKDSALGFDPRAQGVVGQISTLRLKPAIAEAHFGTLLEQMSQLQDQFGGLCYSPDLEREVSLLSDREALARVYLETLRRGASDELDQAREGRTFGLVAAFVVLGLLLGIARLLPELGASGRWAIGLTAVALIGALLWRIRRR